MILAAQQTKIRRKPLKVICSQSDFSANISLASRAVPSRPAHPILGNVLLIAGIERQRLHVRGFDLSLGIETSFIAEVTEGGRVALPAKMLGDIVARLPDGEVAIAHEKTEEDEEEGGIVTLTSRSGSYQLHSLDADEFPELPTIEEGDSVLVPVESFSEGLRATLFATSTEETKQVLTGVHFTLTPESIEFASTDGHRLAIQKIFLGNEDGATIPSQGLEATIPAKSLRELERMLGLRHKEDRVKMSIDEGQAIFELGESLTLTTRKFDGAYPRYRQLLPTQFICQVNVDRRQFQSALERVGVLSAQRNTVRCLLDRDQQQLCLSVESQDIGSGRESMTAQISNEIPTQVVFNLKYLMDVIKSVQSSEIAIHLNSAKQPIVFTPLSGAEVTYLVMPVQVRDLNDG